jgi:cytochrome P450
MATKTVDIMSPDELAHAVFMEGRTRGEELWQLLDRLQALAPLHWFAAGDFWIATGNAEVREVLKSPLAEMGFAERNDRTQPGWRDHHSRTNMAEWMGHKEGANHRHMRGAVNPFFMPAMARASEEHLRAAIRKVVADFRAQDGGDFLEEVGYGITAKVTDHLLGLEGRDHPNFRKPIERLMKTFDFGLTDQQWREADEAADELRAFWSEQIRARMANPVGDDLLTCLIRAGTFDEADIIRIAENVLTAGSDTTANTCSNAVHLLLSNPDQLELARHSAEARARVFDEAIRLVSAASASGRLVVRDMAIAGQVVPAGSTVITIIAAANRDPLVFEEPHRMDLTREPSSKAVGFGVGTHVCLGQWFARSAIAIVLDEMLDQCATITFDGPAPEPVGIGMRQLPHLRLMVS